MQQQKLPAALLIGLVLGFAGTLMRAWASVVTELGDIDLDNAISARVRWDSFAFAAGVAGSLLVVVALFGLATRSTGARRILLLVVSWIYVVGLVLDVTWPLVDMLNPRDSYREMLGYLYRVNGAANFGGIIMLSIATRAWSRSALTVVAAVAAIVASLLGTWLPYFFDWIFESLWENHRNIFHLYWPVREVLWAGGILAMVHGMMRDASPAITEPRFGSLGFRTAGGALLGRVLAGIALALMGMGMVKSLGSIEMMLVIAPTIASLTTIVFAAGLAVVDRANFEGLPRIRWLLGAAISAWSGAIQLEEISRMHSRFFGDAPDSWTVLNPILGVVGVLLVMTAIHSFAIARGNEKLRQAAHGRIALYFVMMLLAVGGQLALSAMHDPASFAILGVLATVCGIVGLIAAAGLLSIAADSLGTMPQLPEARLHKSGPPAGDN